MSYRVLLILWVPLGEKCKEEKANKTKGEKQRKTWKEMKTKEKEEHTFEKKHLKKRAQRGTSIPPPRQLKKLLFDIRPQEFGIEFLKFVGFLNNFETCHAIATSAAAIKRSFSLRCRCLPHEV